MAGNPQRNVTDTDGVQETLSMEPSKSTADRIRPILAAMERSIDAVRRERLGEASLEDQESSHTTNAPKDGASTSSAEKTPNTEPTSNGTPAESGRLKAKPKRPDNVIGRWSHPSTHSQAG